MIDLNFLLPFLVGGLTGCAAVGGYHLVKIAEVKRELRRIRNIKTPRTDAEMEKLSWSLVPEEPIEFARQLERKLNEAKKDSEILDWLLDHAVMHYQSFDLDDRDSIRDVMNAMKAGEEPYNGDPTTEEREAKL